MKTFISALCVLFLASSCFKGQRVDLIIHNAKIHVMDDQHTVHDAIAVKDGIIIEVGPERQILNKYSAKEKIDAQKKDLYPGFTDAHGHILSYARQKLSADLVGCESYDAMLVRLEKYQSKNKRKVIIGRGWDQSLWGTSDMPTNERLNELFPNTPVCLIRIDGHALLANDKMIQVSGAFNKLNSAHTVYEGGQIHINESNEPTGIFVDKAMDPILAYLPEFPTEELQQAIHEIQEELIALGITGVHEAGVTKKELDLLKRMVDAQNLKINLYCMLLPSEENITFAQKNGIYNYRNLLVRSFKVYGDGALGSRGACLKHPYSDKTNHVGHMTITVEELNKISSICRETGYQMNTHAIGDSTNKVLLDLYQKVFEETPDHRWRIEHAQVIDPNDFMLFAASGTFPSVQPTHAISDQRWAMSRLGSDRIKGAYAYNSLINQYGMIAIGTDFPVEITDPFRTIHAAVQRKDTENFPSQGFLPTQAITLDECIRGMTIWAAFASFQENQLGTIEKGKDATFVLFESPVVSNAVYSPNFAYMTFIKGQKVYSVE